MGGSAFEETLEIDCCCLVRGSRGLVNGKTVMRLSREKIQAGADIKRLWVVWLISFPSFWNEMWVSGTIATLYLYCVPILCSCVPLARWTLTLSSTVEHAAPPRPPRLMRRLKRLVSLCVHAPPAAQSLRQHEDPLPSAL